jgi:hypothetical protein
MPHTHTTDLVAWEEIPKKNNEFGTTIEIVRRFSKMGRSF